MPDHQNGQRILTINTGSSSLKIGLYQSGAEITRILSGELERLGQTGGHFRIKDAHGVELIDHRDQFPDHSSALNAMLAWLRYNRPDLTFDAVGHRVVHGGMHFNEPQRVTPELIAALKGLVTLAPNHMPQAIEAIESAVHAFPELPQLTCFDTAFHRQMPKVAQMYPLTRSLNDEGVIRYGFHGLSYEYIIQELRKVAPQEAAGRVIIAHMGNGASMAAVRDGIGIDTTMGFTPTGGLMMGTRPGDLDPGVLLYLLADRKMTRAALNDLVNRQAGLLGISGISEDMRDLLERESTDLHAADAIELYCYKAKKFVGAMTAALGGLNTLIFTGGIGENASPVRARICKDLEFLGVELHESRNAAHAGIISSDGSQTIVRVIRTDEDLMIAKSVSRVLGMDSKAKEIKT